MRVRLIETDQRRDVERFIRFPYALYRDSPFWVPPLLAVQRRLLNKREHPFYRHSDADFFVAEEGVRTVGRIALLENRPFNAYHHSHTAQFGYLELVDDAAVAQALFDAVCQRARERGLDALSGPWTLLRTDGSGVLVKGFEHLPAMGIPYNPPYYDGLIQRQGLAKEYDTLSGYLVQGHQLPERIWTIAERVKEKRGFSVVTFADRREMRAWVPRVAELYRNAFAAARGFAPPSDGELAVFAETIIAVADPRLIKLVLKGEEVVGFILAYPNVTRGLQRAGGRLLPFGWYYLLRERRTTKHVDLNGVGLLPQYQGLGANALLYAELTRSLNAFGAEYADVVQVSEDNCKSFSDMETVGVRWHKVHRHYQRAL
ncbi:MAG: hypothetical protein GX557_07910 [Chloroflexi bacterium]|nr:hypothetical protein [Chloroflexota bacterium]